MKKIYLILMGMLLMLIKPAFALWTLDECSLQAPLSDPNIEEAGTFTIIIEACVSGSAGGYDDPVINAQMCTGLGCSPVSTLIPSSNGLSTPTNPVACGNACKGSCINTSFTITGNTAGDYVIDGFCDTGLSGNPDTATQAITVNTAAGDTEAPNITLINPVNNLLDNSRSINFTFNATTNDNFANCSLWTNETSWSEKQLNTTAIINASLSGINETFTSDGDFLWNIRCVDTDGNFNFSASNFTILIDTVAPTISQRSINATPRINDDVNFSIVATDDTAMDTCRLYLNDTGTFISQGLMNGTPTSNFTFIISASWNAHDTLGWFGGCNDTSGNDANDTIQTFTIQNTNSTVTIDEPPTNTIFENVNLSIQYTYSDGDSDSGTCRLYLNGSLNATNTSVVAGTQTNITSNITVAGDYLVVIGCNDGFTEINSSSIVLRLNITVVDNPPTISSNSAINNSRFHPSGINTRYNVTVTDDNGVDTVLFEIDGVNVTTSLNSTDTFNYTDICLTDNVFNWTDIWANDTIGQNTSLVIDLSWTCDVTVPVVGGKTVNATTVYTNAIVSLNISGITDNFEVNTTWTTVNYPDGTKENLTMTSIGNNFYQVNVSVGANTGTFYYNTTYVNDTAGNINSNTTILNITVTTTPEAPSPRFIIRNSSMVDVLWITDIGELFFDLNDYIVYDLSGNRFLFYINNVVVFCINSTGGFTGNNTC